MKIEKYLFLVACMLMLATNTLKAQTYQPFPVDDASWNMARCWYLFAPGWNDTYDLSMDGSDTLYQGEVFKKLYIVKHEIHGAWDSLYPIEFFGGIREDNKQIFMFQTWGTVDLTEHLVYDFTSTNVGDTIYTSALSGPPTILFGHVVMSVDSVLVGSAYHKRLYLEDPNNSFNTEYWIEGVGSSWGLPYASFWSITDNSYDLTCFYEDQNLQYGNPSPNFSFCTAPMPETNCSCLGGLTINTSICNGDSLFVGGAYQTFGGAYIDTLLASSGCDSIVTTQLTINSVVNSVSEVANVLTASNTTGTYQWLDCENNYAIISGETNQSFTATANGSYAVAVTENGCVDTSACFLFSTIGILENEFENLISVSPNPTRGQVEITFNETIESLEVSLIDMNGAEVSSDTFTENASFLFKIDQPAGLYILKIRSGNRTARIRIIKE